MYGTHFVFGERFDDDGTKHAGKCADAVGNAHEDGSVTWGDVQVIDVESRNGKSTETDSEDKGSDGVSGIATVSDHHEENGLHSESATVEHFTHHSRR